MKSLADLAGSVPVGLIVVDGECRILLHNATASTILERNPLLELQDGTLIAPQHKRRLRLLIRSAINSPGELCGMSIPQPNNSMALIVVATAIAPPTSSSNDAVALIVSDPGLRWVAPFPVLRDLYGFTRAEAELASHLINGDSLATIAATLKTSLHTVRSHLKKLFQKTGTGRQAELVRVLLMASVLLGAPAESLRLPRAAPGGVSA